MPTPRLSECRSARIDALEMRLTEQDVVIDDLNATITAQWRQIDALTRQMANSSKRSRQPPTARARGPRSRRRRIIEG